MERVHYEMIEIGCLACMAIYQLILFFQVKKNYYLYLSLICVTVMVRSMLVGNGSLLMFHIFPGLNYMTGRKIEFLAAYSNILLLPLFIHDIFKFQVFNRYVKFFVYLGGAWLVLIIVTPYSFFFKIDLFFQGVVLVDFLFVFRMLYIAKKKRKTGAGFITIGIVFCFVFVFMEMLRISGMIYFNIDGPNLINTGVVLFLFFLSIALSAVFAESFNENIKLNSELNERVFERTRALSESNLVKDHIIRTISHDLRAPLANLRSLVSLSKMENTDQRMGEHYAKVNKGIDYSLDLLDDLLAWASSNRAGKEIKTYFEKINLQEMVFQKIMNLQNQAQEKNIAILNKVEEDVFIHSDKNVLKVVLRNLITNAIKFTHNNGRIQIDSIKTNEGILLKITDNGIGIPDQMKLTLFDMDPNNKRPGTDMEKSTGLGLAIVKDLMSQIQGQISVEDNPEGNGTVFKLHLPY